MKIDASFKEMLFVAWTIWILQPVTICVLSPSKSNPVLAQLASKYWNKQDISFITARSGKQIWQCKSTWLVFVGAWKICLLRNVNQLIAPKSIRAPKILSYLKSQFYLNAKVSNIIQVGYLFICSLDWERYIDWLCEKWALLT